jgi:hypothetical protein
MLGVKRLDLWPLPREGMAHVDERQLGSRLWLYHLRGMLSWHQKSLLERPFYPRKQPMALSGECPVCPETGRSGGSISYLRSGRF